ncbi:MAG: UDP-N-acetylmuramoyl-L-alanine--D-glutamate ligase [Rikenellaceae bacterium]|jgi:UDP-N-acetylmuramoylalanine--D-glutamate ligase|nr:UDP-N-acetylmuramoyl-L-alanine--D-glutamate ligase [Rikenellaceae bacterium]
MKKRIVILGGGESGWGSAVLAQREGFDVFLSDSGRVAEPYRGRLAEAGIAFEEGGHTLDRILSADEAIKSPGIPDKAPVVRALRERGVAVISEIEFAGRYLRGGRTVCITGSNGKTTTTTLIYNIMREAGRQTALGGNIGQSFAYAVATGDYDWYVLEISSFQLDGMFDFRADVAVLTNITPDHLDRYDYDFQNYIDSKFRIVRNQRAEDFFIYSGDDPVIAENLPRHELPMQLVPFSAGQELCIPFPHMKIRGLHNKRNALAASMAAAAAGVDREAIARALENFQGVEHRLEPVAEVGGVEWINDSKATNVDSVWYALQSMTRPVVWIAGGTDKGNDYGPLLDLAREKVHTLVCMGTDNEKLVGAFTGVVPEVIDTHSLDEAVEACRRAARPGDTALLSPACASFDLFRNYEDRGEQFKKKVMSL